MFVALIYFVFSLWNICTCINTTTLTRKGFVVVVIIPMIQQSAYSVLHNLQIVQLQSDKAYTVVQYIHVHVLYQDCWLKKQLCFTVYNNIYGLDNTKFICNQCDVLNTIQFLPWLYCTCTCMYKYMYIYCNIHVV